MTKTYRKQASYCISGKKKNFGMSTDPTLLDTHTVQRQLKILYIWRILIEKCLDAGNFKAH